MTTRKYPYRQFPHAHAGSNPERQSVGDPGHCESCVSVGHIAAHPDLGCADVGCDSDHTGDTAPLADLVSAFDAVADAEYRATKGYRISRDSYGLRMAEAAASRADCTRRQVGAVIVNDDGDIVATGYNGAPAGEPGCLSAGACPRGQMSYEDAPAGVGYEETRCIAIHAEVNAVIRAGRSRAKGCTIYVTDEPCYHCSIVIRAAGIVRVVTPSRLGLESSEVDRTLAELATRSTTTWPSFARGLVATVERVSVAGYQPVRSTPHRKAALEELIGKHVDMSIPDGERALGDLQSLREEGDHLWAVLDHGYALDANAPGFAIREFNESEKEQS